MSQVTRATALIHEAYVRLVEVDTVQHVTITSVNSWQNLSAPHPLSLFSFEIETLALSHGLPYTVSSCSARSRAAESIFSGLARKQAFTVA